MTAPIAPSAPIAPHVPLLVSNIPAKLKSLPNWVCWRFVWKPDKQKWSKVPISPITGYGASSKNPKQWGTFAQAADYLLEDETLSGVGFVFAPGCGVFGIDVDGAVKDSHGNLNDAGKAVLASFESYTEWSPSKKGFHVLVEGELPGSGFCNMDAGVEMYDNGRFFTVTGDVLGTRSRLSRPEAELVHCLYDQFRTGAAELNSDPSVPAMPSPDPDHPELAEPQMSEVEHGVHEGDRHGGDHSKAYFTLARELLSLGWTPAQVLYVLSSPENGISAGALRRRDNNLVSAQHWLWQYNIAPALKSQQAASIDHLFTQYDPIVEPSTPNKATTAAPKATPDLLFHTPATIPGSYQPMRHLIRDVIALRSASVLVSPPNVGKSALALDIALAVATGTPWSAHQREVNQGPVLIIAAESPRSIVQRMEALRHAGLLPDDAPIMVTDFAIDLSTPATRDRTGAKIGQMFKHSTTLYGRPPNLIIVDTLGRAAPAIDENSFEDMGGLTDWILKAAHDPANIEAHWMVVHHTGKDTTRGARGHSSITGNFDTEIHLTRNEDTPSKQITMSFHKQRDLPGKDSNQFHYHIESWPTGHKVPDFGHDETAAVAVHDLSSETTDTELQRAKDHESSLNEVAKAVASHGHEGLSACASQAKMTPEKFKQAIERWELTDPGAILIDYGAGKQNRNVYRLGPAALERLDSLGIEPEPTGDAGMTPWERRTGRYLRAVKEVGLDGVREMEQATGVARPNLRVALRRLEEAGLVRRVGDGGKGKGDVSAWLLTDPGHAELDSGGAA